MRGLFFWLAVFASAHAQFIKLDHEEPKKADEKNGDEHQKAWKDYLTTLKQGAVYQAEIVHRADDGELYYYRVLFGPKAPRPEMYGLGVNAKGECVPPPDPGYQRLQQLKEVVRDSKVKTDAPPPPLAFTTHYLDVELIADDANSAQIRTSDVATNMPLPAPSGDVTSVYFNGLFRLQRLTEKQIETAEPLRQDAKAMQARLAELRNEALADKENLGPDMHRLSTATRVWHDDLFTNAVRERLTAWINQKPDEVKGKGFPNDLAYALGDAGNKDDFTLFRKVGQRHPDDLHFVAYPALLLLKRTTGPDAVPLFRTLLQNAEVSGGNRKHITQLRAFDKTIPEPTIGDGVLVTFLRVFMLKPDEFHLANVATQVLTFRDRIKLESNELQYVKDASANGAGDWLFLSANDRQRGIAAALKWIEARK